MQKMADVANRTLTWSQPGMMSAFELRAGETLVGTLALRSMWGTQAIAECGDGSWTFKRVGFLHPRVTVRATGSERDIAVFHNNTWSGGGSLAFSGGPTFQAATNFWQTKYEVTTPAEEPLVRLHYGGFFTLHADVEILPSARSLPELPIVVLLSWYLAVMLHRDSATAAAAVPMVVS